MCSVPSAGSVIVTRRFCPALRPLMTSVRVVPRKPTITRVDVTLPSSITFTVPVEPVPAIAWLGTVTPSACAVMIDAVALIPGRTCGLLWDSVSITS